MFGPTKNRVLTMVDYQLWLITMLRCEASCLSLLTMVDVGQTTGLSHARPVGDGSRVGGSWPSSLKYGGEINQNHQPTKGSAKPVIVVVGD